MKNLLVGLLVIVASGCVSIDDKQEVSYVDFEGTQRDVLGRNATYANTPVCGRVTLKGDLKECVIRR